MDNANDKHLSRRQFIAQAATTVSAAAAAELTSGCSHNTDSIPMPQPTEAQMSRRRQSDSPLFIGRYESYESVSLDKMLKQEIINVDLPNLKGKTVLIKPNMVDYWPERQITTNAKIVELAVQLVDHLGAKEIIVGEAPGHMRDTELLLKASGIGDLVKRLGLRFVDLNLDDIEAVPNPHGFSALKEIYLPKTALHADALVSVPKLKTHHWARLTCSMKNLYGCVPGRKYGWPKNILHWSGIDNCIIDLNMLLRPAIQVVDAIVAMEGDGPLNGTVKQANFIMIGADGAAVDSTCARLMGIEPHNVPYLKVAGQVIGNVDPAHIKTHGLELASVCTPFKPSPNFDRLGRAVLHEDPLVGAS